MVAGIKCFTPLGSKQCRLKYSQMNLECGRDSSPPNDWKGNIYSGSSSPTLSP